MQSVYMPRIDPGMQTGKIVEWLKKEGDRVERGEPILVVEGEKTTFEIEAPAAGVLRKTLFAPGDDVPVTVAVALIGEPHEPLPAATPKPPAQPSMRSAEAAAEQVIAVSASVEVRASPAARRLAREHDIDLASLQGSGPEGRITQEDVLAAVERKKLAPQTKTVGGAFEPKVRDTIKLTGIRRTIAERLSYSHKNVVPVALSVEADLTALLKAGRPGDAPPSVTAHVVWAAARALRDHRTLNSHFEDDVIRIFDDVNVAVAVDTPDGLVAPVVHNADRLTAMEISVRIEDLAKKAEGGRLSLSELTGGTFTVSNLGGFGVDQFVPVINPPHCAILGMGRIADKPAVKDGSVIVRKIASLTLVFDHRVTDGAPAARFLNRIKEILEGPIKEP